MKGIAKQQPGGKGKGKRMSKGGKPRLDPAYGLAWPLEQIYAIAKRLHSIFAMRGSQSFCTAPLKGAMQAYPFDCSLELQLTITSA
jgi:hypothetical protein